MLREYEAVVPDTDKRILAMPERQAAHRQRIELRGQFLGFSLAASAFAGGFLTVAGVPLAVVSGIVLAIATLCGFYVWAKARGTKPVPPAAVIGSAYPPASRPPPPPPLPRPDGPL